jgi:serine/threonine protein kinase
MAAPVDPDRLGPGTQLGHYTIVRRLSAGGFGTLYEVDRDGKPYALKLLRERLVDTSSADRSRREIRADAEAASLKALNHRNIVRIHAMDRWPDLDTGHPYLVMDLIRGDELRAWCAARSPSPLNIAEVFEKIALALQHMHERGIIHRDLKSENVLIREDGEPIIIDFGIARGRTSRRVTEHVALVGTPTHYPPEYLKHRHTEGWAQGESFPWTPATDLYALGYMLYELLAGRPPFIDDGNDLRLWKAIQEAEPEPPSACNATVPRELEAVAMRLLAKKPADRHASAEEVAHELRALRNNHSREGSWTAPLDSSGHAATDGGSDALPADHLEFIDDLVAQGNAMAGYIMDECAQGGAGDTAKRTTDRKDASVDLNADALRALREKAELAASGRRRLPRPLLVVAVAGALLFLGGILLGTKPARSEPTSLMSKAAGADADPRGEPVRSAAVSSAPSADDARAIDKELEARFGDRPTVTRDGRIINLPKGQTASGARRSVPTKEATSGPVTPIQPGERAAAQRPDEPLWLKRTVRPSAHVPATDTPKVLGIPVGSHIAARLLTTLDSRTVASGPVEARTTSPLVVRGRVALPTGTLVYGQASEVEGRFVIRFDRLRLPDDREVKFAGLAMDRDDRRPGLPASRRIASERHDQPASTLDSIVRSSAGTVLNTVTGGLAQDLVRGAGHTALQQRDTPLSAGRDVQVIEPGVLFDVWVETSF